MSKNTAKGGVKADSAKKTLTTAEAHKKYDETIKKSKKIPGLFNFYQDTTNGSLYMELSNAQLDKEYIYMATVSDGLTTIGLNRGTFRDNKIITFRRYFDKIDIINVNTGLYFDPASALSKAAEANTSNAVLATKSIAGKQKDNSTFLIAVDDIYFSEALTSFKPQGAVNLKTGRGAPLSVNINKEKCKYTAIKNYPLNSDVVVEYALEATAPVINGQDNADSKYAIVKIRHSFTPVPANNYKPRFDDARVGFFNTEIDDQTTASGTPYHDFIHRWHLEKKDKSAAMSEPVEPITYWLEKTTPVELRESIIKAALLWNKPFEKIGFKNAIVIKQQADTATWDAEDIRYNTLRWTSSSSPLFGGYGPSFVNPRTGQIIAADIMFEYAFITNRLKQDRLYGQRGLDAGINDKPWLSPKMPAHNCNLSDGLQIGNITGLTALMANGADASEKSALMQQSINYLILHEMGHTLGLMHNMKASQMLKPEELNNTKLTDSLSLMGSVMDYPTINLAPTNTKQGLYYSNAPGPYDYWAINYGYSESADSEEAEKVRLSTILAESTKPNLIFGNDADDMRSPGATGIDPRTNIYELSGGVIDYSITRLQQVNSLIEKIKAKYVVKDQSYQDLRWAYTALTTEAANAGNALSRYVGGVYVDHAFAGQVGATRPYTAVSLADQQKAVKAISVYLFGPKAFSYSEDLYAYLQPQRRGFGFFEATEDPKIADRVMGIQKAILAHLMAPNVLKRMTDATYYGNKYTVTAMLGDLTNGIFKEDISASTTVLRQNLQQDYVAKLLAMVEDGSDNQRQTSAAINASGKAAAHSQLKTIKRLIDGASSSDASTKAHREYISFKINQYLTGVKN